MVYLYTYDVKLGDGRVVRHHTDHVQSRTSHLPLTEVEDDCPPEPTVVLPDTSGTTAPRTELQRLTRVSRPPDRLMF